MSIESWGDAGGKYHRPILRPALGAPYCRRVRRASILARSNWLTLVLVVVVVSLIIVTFEYVDKVQAQFQENPQMISTFGALGSQPSDMRYQDIHLGTATGLDENNEMMPSQQTIDQQRKYLAYLIQQQQQRLKQQQVQMNPHASFYSLVDEPQQPELTRPTTTSRPPFTSSTNQRLPASAGQQQQAVQMWHRKQHHAPNVLTSMQLPNRAHHYKPPVATPTQGSGIVHSNQQQQQQIDTNRQYRPLLSIHEFPSGDGRDDRERKQQTYSSPLVVKPRAKPVNLSSLLQPGEVMLSAREVHRPYSGAPATKVRNSTSVVGVRQIESLLGHLRPLALSERDKATNLHQRQQPVAAAGAGQSGDTNSSGLNIDYDEGEDRDQEREDESEMIDDKAGKGESVDSPESRALFGVLSGGGRSRSGASRKLARSSARDFGQRDREEENEQMASFLQGLKSLSSELLNDAESPGGGGGHEASASSPNYEQFYRAAPSSDAPRRRASAESRQLPIELLVDHLMAGSRLATRGGSGHGQAPTEVNPVDDPDNHRDRGPIDYEYGSGDDDDDEDDPLAEEEEDTERDYEDSPDNGLGAGLLESEESMIDETRVSAPISQQKATPVNGNDTSTDLLNMANSTTGDSWTPLTVGHSRNMAGVPQDARLENESSGPESKRRRRRRKRRRRRRRREGSQRKVPIMTIGNKTLSREELIRLIRALNKIANDPTGQSSEREASRRLLRHLIKLALANFKRQQRRPHEKDGEEERNREREEKRQIGLVTNERLRESLSSMLVEPNLTSVPNEGGTTNSSSTKISIRMQPWRLKPALSINERLPLDEDEAIREPPREHDDDDDERGRGSNKSLGEISEDLERYFDTDFFEDLADQGQRNVSSGEQSTTSDTPKSATSERSRPAAAATNSPVPVVYGHRELEAADEEDVDLDHVRLTVPLRGSVSSKKKRKKQQLNEGGRRKRRQRRKLRTKHQRPKMAATDSDRDETEEVTERRQEESKPVRVRARAKRQRRRRKRGKKRREQTGDRDDANGRQESERGAGDDEHEEQKQAPLEDVGSHQDEEQGEEDEANNLDQERGQVAKQGDDVKLSNGRNRQSKRRLKSNRMRNPSRDNVPAPIVAAKMSKDTRPNAVANKMPVKGKAGKSTLVKSPGGKSSSSPPNVQDKAQVKNVESKKGHDKEKLSQEKKVATKKTTTTGASKSTTSKNNTISN